MIRKRILWFAILFLAIGAFGLIAFFLFLENATLKTQIDKQTILLEEKRNAIVVSQNAGLMLLMDNVLQQVDEELSGNVSRTLSDETILRIAALSNAFKPIKYSLERGQLLLSLALKKMNPESWSAILEKTTFEYADLSNLELQNIDMQNARLRWSNFRNSKLEGANLKNAFLKDSDFSGAILNNAILTKVNMDRSIMNWAELNNSRIDSASIQGAQMENVKLRNANLSHTSLKRSHLSGAVLTNATLFITDCWGTNFMRANLKNANLEEATLVLTDFSEANLSNTNINQALIKNEDWFKELERKNAIGVKELKKIYIPKVEKSFYRLRKKES